MSTELTRPTGQMDLTRAPWAQWSAGMVKLAKQTVLRDAKSDSEVYYCLALAESVGLNPFANEIYFIPRKGRDGAPAGVTAYIGREGLVKKAAEREGYFTVDTVREHDAFKVTHNADGTAVEHSYGQESERGEIVGAWSLLYLRAHPRPAYAYAPLSEFLPSFDQSWKMEKSPWGNQRSAMIEKCAMIMAARQRLNTSGVLIDAEMDRMGAIDATAQDVSEVDWGEDEELAQRLRLLFEEANRVSPGSYRDQKVRLQLAGADREQRLAIAQDVETFVLKNGGAAPVVGDPPNDELPESEPERAIGD